MEQGAPGIMGVPPVIVPPPGLETAGLTIPGAGVGAYGGQGGPGIGGQGGPGIGGQGGLGIGGQGGPGIGGQGGGSAIAPPRTSSR